MKILVTGGTGQLGRALRRASPDVVGLSRDDLDVTDMGQIEAALARYRPRAIINAAGFTNVDLAETQRESAFAVNAIGAGNVARACQAHRVPLLHVSTDYVFDGSADAYREGDPTGPLNVYGESKRAGETTVLACGGSVVRTSWLFGSGGPSFVHAIVRLARLRPALEVVDDQRGCPTGADQLARALVKLVDHAQPACIYHACGSPPTTRYAWAKVIVDEARERMDLACTSISPIPTSSLRSVAARPASSVLLDQRMSSLGIEVGPWSEELRRMLEMELRP